MKWMEKAGRAERRKANNKEAGVQALNPCLFII
jgi:hypothetical protein